MRKEDVLGLYFSIYVKQFKSFLLATDAARGNISIGAARGNEQLTIFENITVQNVSRDIRSKDA